MRPMLFLLAFVTTSVAATPSYDYLDVSALGLAYDQPSGAPTDDAVGVRFRSSVAFDDEWFWTFEAAALEYSAEQGGRWGFNLGYAFPLDSMDVAVTLGFGRLDFGTVSGGGFQWDVIARSANWDHFELNAHVGQKGVDPVDDFINYGVGMVWTPGDSFGVVLEYELATGSTVDLNGYAVGVRWTF